MQASNERIAISGNPNRQTLALFVLLVYIVIMPKELVQLACVFVGAVGYLFFLLLHPSTESYPSTPCPPALNKTKNIEVEGIADLVKATKPTEFFQASLNKITEVAPIAELLAPAVAKAVTTDNANTFAAKQPLADVESSDDESIAAPSDGNHETTGEEPMVKAKTTRMPSEITAHAEENLLKLANIVGCPPFQQKRMVRCPRFQTASGQEKETQKSSEQLQERENQWQKDNWARLAASKKLVPPPSQMRTAMPVGATRTKLSSNATPFFRNNLSVDATRFFCSPCVQQQAPSLSMQLEDDSEACWQWVSRGFCPRGPRCQWEHPRTEKVQEQFQSYETVWKFPRTERFQKQFQNYETAKPLPTNVSMTVPAEFFELTPLVQTPTSGFAGSLCELNGQTMAQTRAFGQCGTYFEDHGTPVADNSVYDKDSDDILTDDGF